MSLDDLETNVAEILEEEAQKAVLTMQLTQVAAQGSSKDVKKVAQSLTTKTKQAVKKASRAENIQKIETKKKGETEYINGFKVTY